MKDIALEWPSDEHTDIRRVLPKVTVIQAGARHGYQFPRILNQLGALERLETSWAEDAPHSVVNRVLRTVSGQAGRKRHTALGEPLVCSTPAVDVARVCARLIGVSQLRSRQFQNHLLGRSALRRFDDETQVILSIDGNGGAQNLAKLKRRGAKILVDVAISPLAYDRMERAEAMYPDWLSGGRRRDSASAFRDHYDALVRVADVVLYPSDSVLNGLRALPNFDETCARLLPYPTEATPVLASSPRPGHVLFAGSDPVRKGLPDLARAMTYLRCSGRTYHLTVAGHVGEAALSRPEMTGTEITGYLSQSDLAKRRAKADIFVLPSWAEGLPAAGIEAMAAGLPVVATLSAGLPIDHGRNGFLVPEGDPRSLAEAIGRIVRDRSLRADMSRQARATAKRFEPQVIREALVRILAELDASDGDAS